MSTPEFLFFGLNVSLYNMYKSQIENLSIGMKVSFLY